MSDFFAKIKDSLNAPQAEAVSHLGGPLLVLAGAGSGKTRVLTYRIAFLVKEMGIPLNEILAMTFSNKAAREMHSRVKALLHDESSYRYPWISTFHSVCVRLLRIHGSRIGLNPQFVIYDSKEQLDVIKDCFQDLGLSDKAFHPKSVHEQIGKWKNEARRPQAVSSRPSSFEDVCHQVYDLYQKKLRQSQAVDFDDLLLETFHLLDLDEALTLQLQNQWKHILIDEFQDTNQIQFKLMEKLINSERNICVVGDDDQSIYAWRGAQIENILNFDKKFQGCKVIKLEQNYRSTSNILNAAGAVIAKNQYRHAKTIWTEQGPGPKIKVANLEDDRKEAQHVVNCIRSLILEGMPGREIAVLYRVNSISRVFEEECLRQRIPYKIVGGFRFYERKEIKDIVGYLKVLMNPFDVIAFRRVINTPPRGVGRVSLEKLELEAQRSEKPIAQWLLEAGSLPITGKAKSGVAEFKDILSWGQRALAEEESLADLIFQLLEKTRYIDFLKNERTEEAKEREENLKELMSAVQEFEERWHLDNQEVLQGVDSKSILQKKIFDFLERIALISDADQLDEVEEDQVTFMSLHAAKGLEFQACFMAAMEDGLFPSVRSLDSMNGLEEERRLCYVGMTRAKERLYLTRSERRRTFGSINDQIASRFLADIPQGLMESYVDPHLDLYRQRSIYKESFSQYKKPKTQPHWDDENYSQAWPEDFDTFTDFVDSDAASSDDGFHMGDRVKHPSFGDGVVKKVEILGSDECLTIDFMRRGRKRVLAQFVQRTN